MEPTWKSIMSSFDEYSAQQRKTSAELTKEQVALSIRKFRIENGNMSMEELARFLGVPRIQVYRWEQARNKPSAAMLALLKEKKLID